MGHSTVSCAITAAPIEMPFLVEDSGRPNNHVLDEGADPQKGNFRGLSIQFKSIDNLRCSARRSLKKRIIPSPITSCSRRDHWVCQASANSILAKYWVKRLWIFRIQKCKHNYKRSESEPACVRCGACRGDDGRVVDNWSVDRRSRARSSKDEYSSVNGRHRRRPQHHTVRLPDCNAARLSWGAVGRHHHTGRVSTSVVMAVHQDSPLGPVLMS